MKSICNNDDTHIAKHSSLNRNNELTIDNIENTKWYEFGVAGL